MSKLRTRSLALTSSLLSFLGAATLALAFAAGGAAVNVKSVPAGNNISDQNHPEYWENLYPGTTCIKITSGFQGDTYVVPAPPAGTVWRIIVLKYATINDVYDFPAVGAILKSNTGQNLSHVMACYILSSTTTTTAATTTTTAPTTTTTAPTTTTTQPTTTTTDPSTTTTDPSTTTTDPSTTTTDPSTTTTASVQGTTIVNDPGTTTTVTVLAETLAKTGSDSDVLTTLGLILLGLGGFLLLFARRSSSRA